MVHGHGPRASRAPVIQGIAAGLPALTLPQAALTTCHDSATYGPLGTVPREGLDERDSAGLEGQSEATA